MALGSMSREGSMARGSQADTRSIRGSQTDGARSKTPPGTPKKCGKLLGIRVLMLDDSITLFQVQAKASGKMLFDQVCKQLNLLETDYFGLEYSDNRGSTYWLDRDKAMNQQIGLSSGEPLLRFTVKFYIPDPSQLEEEYTRYLFSLQIKRDLAAGQLQCNDNTAALMASYIVQAQCGDYVVEDYPDHTYLSSEKFVPGQDEELERRICDNHKKHTGQSPAEADLNLLETARRCELYGTKMHSAKDHEGVPLNLAVAHLGVLVFQNCTKINTFSWAKIRKLSFKRKKFLIKLHPEGYGYYKDIVEFYFDERNHCKNFWKKCVEHHGFFRCTDTPNINREKARIISRGSSFRYSGRTQKQMQEHVRENFVKRQSFQRHVRSLHGSLGNVGSSISAQPLLPGTDNDIANGNAEQTVPKLTNNNVETEQIMKRQSSIRPSSPPAGQPQDNQSGSDADATITSLSGSHPTTSQSTPLHSSVPASPFRLLREESVDGTLSPVSFKGGMDTLDNDTTGRRKRHPTDKAYFIAKEILMTERTYKKDLEVINLWFRDEVSKEDSMPEETLTLLFSHIDPLYELHAAFLKDIEQRMATWEGRGNAHLEGDYRKIGDVILKNLNQNTMEHYCRYIDTHLIVLDKLEQTIHKNSKFEQVYRDFEMQKVCYLPLTTLLLKPLHRVLHYQLLLERLLNHYGCGHHDYTDTNMALSKVRTIIKKLSTKLKESENLVKLMELQRDLVGYDNLVQAGREFVREGCLQKLSRKGYQQRMFFLFSDMLLYANRTTTPGLQFRVHGQLAVPDLQVVDSEPRMGADFCFNIYDGKRALMVAAASQGEKLQWMEDIAETVQYARERGLDSPTNKYLSLKSMSGSDDGLDRSELQDIRPADSRPSGQRSNSSVHVCWHRATSVAIMDHQRALENQLSGYLLRKFKNSNGWQKLWVVFTNFCLYFYKTFQDDFPLASLPLLGYSVDVPSQSDDITKDYVFKLQFKNHVYFFRAESQFTFDRWMEVLSSATRSPANTAVVNGVH
eukprot:GFUD01004766.1.p1 GENE.GFUD01004766.1~~GFUD01004766.1.p1  ORF type:complete len:1020 (-),score=189.29 GFUD01004766.1:493-3552(-)